MKKETFLKGLKKLDYMTRHSVKSTWRQNENTIKGRWKMEQISEKERLADIEGPGVEE